LKEDDRKDEVTKVNEEERSSEEEVIRRRMRTALPLSLSFFAIRLPTSSPSFLSVILTTALLPSSQSSSSLLLSLLPLPHSYPSRNKE
jgi:hypothetical protein